MLIVSVVVFLASQVLPGNALCVVLGCTATPLVTVAYSVFALMVVQIAAIGRLIWPTRGISPRRRGWSWCCR